MSALATAASATAFLGLAATADATPVGPCADVPYVGVCVPASEQPSPPTQHSLGEVAVPSDGSTGLNVVN
ncbi:hypothetical protein [Mycobacterium sp. MMS18-G62]